MVEGEDGEGGRMVEGRGLWSRLSTPCSSGSEESEDRGQATLIVMETAEYCSQMLGVMEMGGRDQTEGISRTGATGIPWWTE